jgi:hypothetical protein
VRIARKAAVAAALMALVSAVALAAPPSRGASKVTISLKPTSVVFGRSISITGTVQGAKKTPTSVTVQQSPFPFTSFTNAATMNTDSHGNYRFTTKPQVNTRYRVIAKTSPTVTSPIAQENVKFFVSLRLSDSTVSSGDRVRFSGVIRPAHNGGLVQIQRKTSSGWKTVSKTLATASSTGQSAYTKKVKITHAGLYRTRTSGDASHVAGTSPERRISF